MNKSISLLVGASFLALSSVAQANGPMVLSDGVLDTVTAAGTFNVIVNKEVNIKKTVYLDVRVRVSAKKKPHRPHKPHYGHHKPHYGHYKPYYGGGKGDDD